MREELSHRGLSTKGLKAQLLSRLTEALESEKVIVENIDATESPGDEGSIIQDKDNIENPETLSEKEAQVEEKTLDSLTIIESEPVVEESSAKEKSTAEFKIPEVAVAASVSFDDVLVPLVPEKTDENTKQMWRKRYVLPKTPHHIIHPLQTGRTQDFDCSKMCLSTLREYRVHDIKEQSFEVSLFSG